jgi:ubiquinone/menaquinone biosynthesis C-methylase UbiE
MTNYNYKKSKKYTDLYEVYKNCSGPGGLKLTEFLADKMEVKKGDKLLDVGTNSGYQTCFLAKEYRPFIIGIDPWQNSANTLMKNAKDWGVENNIIAISTGVPNTNFADSCFDKVYATTTLEMLRGMNGAKGYKEAVEEIYRVVKPGGIFGLGEPMHNDIEIPEEIYSYVSTGDMPAPWTECFATLEETVEVLKSVGFEIIEADIAPDAQLWWEEFAQYDPHAGKEEKEVFEKDKGRWTTFGYIIAKK